MAALIGGPLSELSGSTAATFVQDAATDAFAFYFIALSATAIKKVQWSVSAKTGTPHDLLVLLSGDTDSRPTGTVGEQPTDIGGGSPTQVAIANGSISVGVNTATFTNAFTPTVGTPYWVVFWPSSTGGSAWGASHKYTHITGALPLFAQTSERCSTTTDTATTWVRTAESCYSFSLLDASDNYLPLVGSAVLTSTTISLTTIDSASSPNEYGTGWVMPNNQNMRLYGMHYFLRPVDTVNSDLRLEAWRDPLVSPVSLGFYAVDISAFYPTANFITTRHYWSDGPYVLTAGATHGVSWRATGSGDLYLRQLLFHSQAAKEAALMLKSMWGMDRSGGSGAFTARYDRLYSLLPWLSIEDVTGGGLARIIGG